ncbi:MAG: Mur ligase family protein [Actinomycetota bacterium]|nr:Mur ligase family protein [Actinomycetota bacterium]
MTELLVRTVGLALTLALGVRWLRVAQREHYLAGRCFWTLRLWMRCYPVDAALMGAAVTALVMALVLGQPRLLLVTAITGLAVPVQLPLRGRTSRLAWTPRLRRVAALSAVLEATVILFAPVPVATAAVVLGSVAVDLALLLLSPVENRLSAKYLSQARRRMRQLAPTVIAITGSFGKTTTKQYLAHLLSGQRSVVPSPASFNNAMGLSRAVNEHLPPGTEVFIAEMGTYGPGEIRRLCEIFPPDVAVITAVGEVHLERMKSLDRILAAKAEITENARTVVLNTDDERLATLAATLHDQGKKVLRASLTDPAADVLLREEGEGWRLSIDGRSLGTVRLPPSVHATNAAVAVAAAMASGADPGTLIGRLESLPSVAHRMEPERTANGGWVLDDTYNSNPAGAAAALQRAAGLAKQTGGNVHVVTPGMVEMGNKQRVRNAELAASATHLGVQTLVAVGRTNRSALRSGSTGLGPDSDFLEVASRQSAMDLLTSRLGPGDVVLFENDLPDHYP